MGDRGSVSSRFRARLSDRFSVSGPFVRASCLPSAHASHWWWVGGEDA